MVPSPLLWHWSGSEISLSRKLLQWLSIEFSPVHVDSSNRRVVSSLRGRKLLRPSLWLQYQATVPSSWEGEDLVEVTLRINSYEGHSLPSTTSPTAVKHYHKLVQQRRCARLVLTLTDAFILYIYILIYFLRLGNLRRKAYNILYIFLHAAALVLVKWI